MVLRMIGLVLTIAVHNGRQDVPVIVSKHGRPQVGEFSCNGVPIVGSRCRQKASAKGLEDGSCRYT